MNRAWECSAVSTGCGGPEEFDRGIKQSSSALSPEKKVKQFFRNIRDRLKSEPFFEQLNKQVFQTNGTPLPELFQESNG